MLQFLLGAALGPIGLVAAAVGTVAVGVAAANSGSSSSSSSTSSDEDERMEEALQEEKTELEEKAWKAFSKQLETLNQSLKREAKELGVGKVSLKGQDNGRMNSSSHSFFGGIIGASAGIFTEATGRTGRNPATGELINIGARHSVRGGTLDHEKYKLPMFSLGRSSLKGEAGERVKVARKAIGQIDFLMLEQVGDMLWDSNSLIASRGLTETQRSILLDLCSKEDVEEFESFISEANKLRPRLAAAGVLKAGKSTMMNCLTGDFENRRFKTGVVRETVKVQVHEQDGYLFVDTPGIDANDQDTRVAAEALRCADVILFAHNMNGGGLDEPERTFLESVHANWDNAASFVDKSIFVLTHLDKKESDRKMVEAEVCKQVKKIFGSQPAAVSVSSSRYLKGVPENKQVLVKKSNYAALNKIIGEKTTTVSRDKKKRYQGRIDEKAKHLKSVLFAARDQKEVEIEQLEAEHRTACNAFKKKVKDANANVAKAYALYLVKIEKEPV